MKRIQLLLVISSLQAMETKKHNSPLHQMLIRVQLQRFHREILRYQLGKLKKEILDFSIILQEILFFIFKNTKSTKKKELFSVSANQRQIRTMRLLILKENSYLIRSSSIFQDMNTLRIIFSDTKVLRLAKFLIPKLQQFHRKSRFFTGNP